MIDSTLPLPGFPSEGDLGPVKLRPPRLRLRAASRARELSSPLAVGLVSAAVALGIALALCVVPSLASELAARHQSVSVLGSILLGLDVLSLAHGGAIELIDGPLRGAVKLLPAGLTAVLAVIGARTVQRRARALELVGDDGSLRTGGVRDALTVVAAHTLAYTLGVVVLAALASAPFARPSLLSLIIPTVLLAALSALAGIAMTLAHDRHGHRRASDDGSAPRSVLAMIPAPYGAVVRAVIIALLGLAAGGIATASVALLVRLPRAGALFDQLDPGVVGGIVLTLVQLALLPTLGIWVLAAQLGGAFTLGTGSHVSLSGVATSAFPALPVLGALPGPGTPPWFAWLLLALPVAALAAGAASVVREVGDLSLRDRAVAWILYPVAVLVAGLALLQLTAGSIGMGRLAHIGPEIGRTLPPFALMVLVVTALAVLIWDPTLRARYTAGVSDLRTRVEKAEDAERRPAGAHVANAASATSAPSADDADDDADEDDAPETGDGQRPVPQ